MSQLCVFVWRIWRVYVFMCVWMRVCVCVSAAVSCNAQLGQHITSSSFLSVCHLYNAQISSSLLMVWLVDFLCLSCYTTPPPSIIGSQIYRNRLCIRVCSSISVCVEWGVTRSPFGAQSRQNKFCQQSLLGKHDGFWLRLCDKFHLSLCCHTHTQSYSDSRCPCNTHGVILIQTFSLPPSFVVHILSMAHTYSLLLSQTHTLFCLSDLSDRLRSTFAVTQPALHDLNKHAHCSRH